MTTEPRILARGIGLGLVNGVLLSLVMVPAFRAGIPPMSEPPGLAFAETLPMPVGLLFHLVYVTFWSTVRVARDHPRLRLATAAALAAVLWVVALVAFFPINGWGLLGLGVSAELIPAALVPHVLFALFLWGGWAGCSSGSAAEGHGRGGRSRHPRRTDPAPRPIDVVGCRR